MFTRKKHFSDRFIFSEASLRQIIKLLGEAGFTNIKFKIPNEYTDFNKSEFDAKEFIELRYNFVSQILIAESDTDLVKVLFINNSNAKANFSDTTFPSNNSEFSKYAIETSDPIRIVGLIDFLDSLLRESSLRRPFVASLQNFLLFCSSIYLFFSSIVVLDIFSERSGVLGLFFLNNVLVLSFLFILSLMYIFFHKVTPGGLYLNKFEHPILSFAKRIFIGDFKNNLLINFGLFVTKLLLGGLLVNIVWYFFGDVLINALKFIPSLF